MNTIQATYFNAISSSPQNIEFHYNHDFSQFKFVDENAVEILLMPEEMEFHFQEPNTLMYFGTEPKKTIKITDPIFCTELKKHLHKSGKLSFYHRMISAGTKTHILVATILVLCILGFYFTIVPWIAEKAVRVIPVEYDIKAGQTFFKEFTRFQEIDYEKTKVLHDFLKELNLKNGIPLKAYYIKSSEKNAFALPDGSIIIYSAIVQEMQKSSELAGLIGHEVAHINNRHSMKMLCRNLAGYMLISLLIGDVNGIMAVVGDNIHSLQTLSYSRQFEKQADYESVQLMCENNVDPQGTFQLFTRLQKESDKLMPEFLSSHPVTEKRIAYLKKLIQNKNCKNEVNSSMNELFEKLKKK